MLAASAGLSILGPDADSSVLVLQALISSARHIIMVNRIAFFRLCPIQLSDDLCWISSDNCVRRNVLGNDCSSCDHGMSTHSP